MSNIELTIFYDGRCPLCVAEMDRLLELDANHCIRTVDLQDEGLLQLYPDLDKARAMTILQGQLANGDFIEGLDVTHKAWSLVGKGYLTFMTRLPVLKWLFDSLYLVFAKNRYQISGWLTGQRFTSGQEACSVCVGGDSLGTKPNPAKGD